MRVPPRVVDDVVDFRFDLFGPDTAVLRMLLKRDKAEDVLPLLEYLRIDQVIFFSFSQCLNSCSPSTQLRLKPRYLSCGQSRT